MNPTDRKILKGMGIALIFFLGIVIYSNTFNSTFQFDDLAFIIKNYAIRNVWDLQGISRAVLSQPSRVIGLYSFALNYHFHQLDVVGYHITNLGIHLMNAFLVWWLASLILQAEEMRINRNRLNRNPARQKTKIVKKKKEASFVININKIIPFAAAVIFLVHPVQTQAVTYISQRFASLATLFYLGSVCFYLKARLFFSQTTVVEKSLVQENRSGQDRREKTDRRISEDRRKKVQPFEGEDKRNYLERRKLHERRSHTARRKGEQEKKWEGVERRKAQEEQKLKRLERKQQKQSAKKQNREKTIQSKICVPEAEGKKSSHMNRSAGSVFFFGMSLICAVLGMFTKEIVITLPLMILTFELFFFFEKKNAKFLVGLVAGLFALAWIIPAVFSFKFQAALLSPRASESHQGDWLTLSTYLLTQLRVLVRFLRLLFFPVGQNFDYDFPMSHSLWEWPTLGSFCLWTGMLWLVVRLFKNHRVCAFGIVWIFITFSANLIPRKYVIFEHKIYLISFGFCLAFVYLLVQRLQDRKKLFVVLALIVGMLSVLTYQRNAVWKDGISLWEDVVKKSPQKIRAHHNLGTYYRKAGRFEEALVSYDAALSLEPNYAISLNQKAGVLREQGDFQGALKEYNRALSIAPELSKLYNNKANVFKSLRRYPEALENYNKAIEMDPNYAMAYYNRGLVLEDAKRYDLSLENYNRVLEIDPEFASAYNNRGRLFCLQKRFDPAIEEFRKAIQFDPDLVEAYFNLARTYEALGQFDLAVVEYNKSIALAPEYAAAFFNLGNIYARSDRYSLAMEYYQKVLQINPDHQGAQINLRKAQEIVSSMDIH